MKGIVFNLLEEIVRNEYGEDVWDDLLEASHSDGVYTSLGSYPDEDLNRIVAAAASALHLPPQEIVRWVGRKSLPQFVLRFPHFFTPHTNTRPFVLTLNGIIHPEVRKLYPGADVPEFEFDTSSPDVLIMRYRSHRKMCAFAQGLIEGAGEHFGEDVCFEHRQCMIEGADECVFAISFAAVAALPAPTLKAAA